MVDSPISDTLDEFLNNEDEDTHSDTNHTESNDSSFQTEKILSNNGLKLRIKKRKNNPSLDSKGHKKKKKSKHQPTYMRRNIRTLFTNDKLQDDTLSALKAEQDRLKRLEEINQQTIYTHIPTNINPSSTIPKANEEECIVLDDDDDDDEDDDEDEDEQEQKPTNCSSQSNLGKCF